MKLEGQINPKLPDKEVVILEQFDLEVVKGGIQLTVKSPLLAAWADSLVRPARPPLVRKGHTFKAVALPDNWDWDTTFDDNNLYASNVAWLFEMDLDKGVKMLYKVPALVPGELLDFTRATFEVVGKIYTRYLNKAVVAGKLKAIYD